MRYQNRNSTPIWALIGINVFIFIITTMRPDIRDQLALTNPISNYWTIITATFVHANFFHIFFNMLILYFFGIFCLQLIDTKWFLVVYFVGGIIGNILFLLIGPEYSIVVGASGAIFAIGGVLAVLRPNQRVYIYFIIPMPLWIAIIIGFLISASIAGVAWQAHLGGLIAGVIAGYIFRTRKQRKLKPGPYSYRF